MDVSKSYTKAEEAIKRKNYDLAVEMLKNQILKVKPTEVKARKLLRAAVIDKYNNQGYPSKSSVMAKGLSFQGKMKLGKMMKKWDMVIEEAENFLLLDPKNVPVLYALGEACKHAKYTETAIAVLESLVSLNSSHLAALKMLGYIHLEEKELKKAEHYFQRANKADPTDQEASKQVKDLSAQITSAEYGKAKSTQDLIKNKDVARELEEDQAILRTDDDYKRAVERCRKKLSDAPEDGKLLRTLGELYQKMQKYEEAVNAYRKVLELDPTRFDIKCKISDCRIAKSNDHCNSLKEQYKSSKDPSVGSALKKALKERLAIEIEEYKMQIHEQPTNQEVRFKLGKALFQSGQLDNAIENFQVVIKDPRLKISALNYMGQTFIKKKEYGLAEEQFKAAMSGVGEKDPKYRDSQYNLGLCYEAAGKTQEATDVFTDIYKKDIRYRDVADRLKGLKG